MWHSTAIATRLIPRILELESKVVDTSSGSFHELTEVSLSMTVSRCGCTPKDRNA